MEYNEWEKSDKDAKPWGDDSTKKWTVKYEVDQHYWNYYCKKSKWQLLKERTVKVLHTLLIKPFVDMKNGIKILLTSKKIYNEADIEQLKHDLAYANERTKTLEFANRQLIEHANVAWDTLAAYRKLDADAAEEQAQKKKAAKKRPSSKKRKG